jgi:hypothetical protein
MASPDDPFDDETNTFVPRSSGASGELEPEATVGDSLHDAVSAAADHWLSTDSADGECVGSGSRSESEQGYRRCRNGVYRRKFGFIVDESMRTIGIAS